MLIISNEVKRYMYSLKQILCVLRNHKKMAEIMLCYLRYVIPDKLYIKLRYKLYMGKSLNLKNPVTYNEKLQWMKLYDRNPLYTKLVDKYLSKKWVSDRIGADHIIPIIGVYEKFDDINFDLLPNQFVIKCSHNCGVVICKDKQSFDIKGARRQINKTMSENYYYWSREWPYKNVPRKIIVEKYMIDESGYELKDYKFFCFNGVPKLFFIATDRGENTTCFDFYDMSFNHLPVIQGHPNAKKEIKKPQNFESMVDIAKKLSKGIKQVRVDLYNVNGQIYFGEMTFFHFGGMVPFVPESFDYKLGELFSFK